MMNNKPGILIDSQRTLIGDPTTLRRFDTWEDAYRFAHALASYAVEGMEEGAERTSRVARIIIDVMNLIQARGYVNEPWDAWSEIKKRLGIV